MLKELYTAALGMLPQQTRLEVIANNIANASTTGFKRESVFERNLIDARANFYNVPGEAEQNDPPVGSYVDWSEGAYQQTNNKLDIALENKNAFFMVQDSDNNQYLTRSGHFKIADNGDIITMDGLKLLNKDNTAINVNTEFKHEFLTAEAGKSIDLKITDHGEVYANNRFLGTIQVAQVNNLSSLQQISNARFVTRKDTDIQYMKTDDVQLKQGWLESSNVNIVNEMVNMIELQRQFELGSKVIQTNDGTLDQSIKIGKFY